MSRNWYLRINGYKFARKGIQHIGRSFDEPKNDELSKMIFSNAITGPLHSSLLLLSKTNNKC